uniref:Uncharacterized protein n=2 Tax=Clastoptera arizonana TaxID=38151 RepID=A0A1B6D088_9HEMI
MYCDPKTNTCSCWSFHDYVVINNHSECIENAEELIKWLSEIKQHYNFSGSLEQEAHSLFFYLGLSGVLSLGLGLIFSLGCVLLIFINRKSPNQKLQQTCKVC